MDRHRHQHVDDRRAAEHQRHHVDRQAAEADKRRKALEDQLNVKLAEAEKTIAATKVAAMANVRGIAADAAKAIVERLTGTAPADKTVDAAVGEALKS